jgi:2-polyprenyl-3-methyl-5-hydroxy-6-metoxy-1,4-benzoquinol methylase
MTTTSEASAPTAASPPTPLDQRVLEATIGALELFGVYLGSRLGLYAALHQHPAATPTELARAAGIAPRYAQEWLEQQAVAGVLTVDDVTADATARRYTLPESHVGVVLDPLAVDHLAPLASMIVGIGSVIDDVAEAYRTGGGVPYVRYGDQFRNGQGGINRPAFTSSLVEEWLPALGPAAERLASGGRFADLGCGQGWSTIAVSRAFPQADVWGFDLDPSSITDARSAAGAHHVAAQFEVGDARDVAVRGPYDVITMLEMLHDLASPVDVLTAARTALASDGVLLVADEAVAPSFTAPGDELERMMYGWSITHCLPAAMVEQPSAAIGTVIREDTVRSLAADAGFASVEVLPIDGGFFRLYALRTVHLGSVSGR